MPLEGPRGLGRSDLPEDLVRFYARNEGIGLESDPETPVRLCRLSEVEHVAWRDVPIFGERAIPAWGDFEGWLIGVSSYLDFIYLVERAPPCGRGAVLMIGPDVAGPGGRGPDQLEASLVLATSFPNWLAHLKRCGWLEYGIAPGEIWDLSEDNRAELLGYYKSLNPDINWQPL
jgi:hypothetical protein